MQLVDLENKFKILCFSGLKAFIQNAPLGILYWLAEVSTPLTLYLDMAKITMMQREMMALWGKDRSGRQIEKMVRRGITNLRKDTFEQLTLVPDLSPQKIKKISFFEGQEHLNASLARGKGVIILLTHFGFRKLIIPALGYAGYKVNQVATHPHTLKKEHAPESVLNKMQDLEFDFDKASPATFIYVESFLRPIYQSLANNEIVIFTIDGPVGLKRVKVPFFHRHILLPPTPFSLGLKQEIPMLPCFVVRQPDNRHKIIIEEPLAMQTPEGQKIPQTEVIKTFVHLLEQYVQKYPCHYADYVYRARLNPITENLHVFQ